MTNEAVIRDTKPLVSRRFTCATGVGIAKGTFLKLSADQTAAANTGVGDIFAGFAHADVNKSTDSNFNTEVDITADKGGVYELVASLAIALGQKVVTAGPNTIMEATDAQVSSSYAIIIGHALEAASAGETINVEVYP